MKNIDYIENSLAHLHFPIGLRLLFETKPENQPAGDPLDSHP